MKQTISIFWFRRDLRLHDNTGLFHALKNCKNVLPIFIFDKNILDDLEDKFDKRVAFIHHTLKQMQDELKKVHSGISFFYDSPQNAIEQLIEKYTIDAVYANHDYEYYGVNRDDKIEHLLKINKISFQKFKDIVVFEKNEVVKDDGKPYTIFTPYSRKWKTTLENNPIKEYNSQNYLNNLFSYESNDIPSLNFMGFGEMTKEIFPSNMLDEELTKKYTEQRNFPSVKGTSKLGIHLRFGTISIRQLATQALPLNETFLNELIWRDFYHMILFHFPHINHSKAFKPQYDLIQWRNNEKEFAKWCDGTTGYPIIDAGMRELNETGFMHNRVRMIVASFLVKHLLIDWRWGEAYFAKKLLDYDFAANNGGWQWAAGSGCDAAPYFRVFNPTLQTEKFDKDLKYIKFWVKELNSFNYPLPIVKHEDARKRCLEVYGAALKK